MNIQVKGVKDIPGDIPAWLRREATARTVFENYGFSEIRAIFEYTDLCPQHREHDIVEKEMYTFEDQIGKITPVRKGRRRRAFIC
jgi:histidyl-tRNA synthetase